METTEKKPIEIKSVTNPTSETLQFKYDSVEYILPAGETKGFIEQIAFLAAKKLADKNAKTPSMDERKVLMVSYLENSPIEVVAKNLGINLEKIRAEVMTKEKEKARMLNLESQIVEQNKKIETLMSRLDKPEKSGKTEKKTK